jgi:hypothetical protein
MLEMKQYAIEILCPGVRIRGWVTTQRRVSDYLNEADTWMPMAGLEMFPLPAAEGAVAEHQPRGLVRRSSIEVLYELTADDATERAKQLGMHVLKTPRKVLVHTPSFAIEGDLHIAPHTDVENTLTLYRSAFIPLTRATARPTSQHRESGPFTSNFLLVNLAHVSFIGEAAEEPPISF